MKHLFKVYPDFPKPGVNFLDINSVTQNRDSLEEITEELTDISAEVFKTDTIDMLVAVESRGFLFADIISEILDCGFVMCRKPGKLPGDVISETYGTEYSDDRLELQLSSIQPNQNVVIHDDILATGGTALAAAKLVERMGGIVKGFIFIGEIEVCEGRSLLQKYPKITSLIKF